MKLLLDMFKTLPKEQRDKAQLMAAEKKVRKCFVLTKKNKKKFYLDKKTDLDLGI